MTLTRYNLASVFLFPFWRWLKWEGNKKIKIKNIFFDFPEKIKKNIFNF